MSGTIAIFDEDMQLLTSFEISQAGSCQQAWMLGDGTIVDLPRTKSEATWTYNYHPIWKEIGWNPWRWLETDDIEINEEVMWLLEGLKLTIEALPNQ